jgi:hypothetical protein
MQIEICQIVSWRHFASLVKLIKNFSS